MGDIVVELNGEAAPLTCVNFLQYAADGFYSGTIFHRVKEHVIQGGGYGPELDLKEDGQRDPVKNESGHGLNNVRGTLAMYREPYRADSAQNQFFINLKDNPSLDHLRDGYGYTVFGKVVEGMDVVDKIAKVEASSHPKYAAGRNPVVPKSPVSIQSITALDALDRKQAFEIAAEQEERAKDPLKFIVRDLEKQHGAKAQKTDSGLVYIAVAPGTGAFPLHDDTVEINFVARLPGVEKPFDSSLDRWNGPGKVRLDSLLPGLKEGIGLMREGGRIILIIPPGLAFGEEGMPARVPPNSSVIYEVELLGVSREEPNP